VIGGCNTYYKLHCAAWYGRSQDQFDSNLQWFQVEQVQTQGEMKREPENKAAANSRPLVMMILLVIAVFCSMLGRAIFSPLMPYLQQELTISLATVGTLFLFVSVSFSVVMMFSGFLSSAVGHGNAIVTALGAIALGLIISGMAGNAIILATGMICIGAGAGTYAPSGIAMINTKINPKRRSTAFAFHEIGPNLAMLVSPLIVLGALPLLGWRGVLFLLGLLCGVGAICFHYFAASDSGVGAKPNLTNMRTILRLPDVYMGMLMFSASIAGWQGVFNILPAYLVAHSDWSVEHVNSLVTWSRVISISMLLLAGWIIRSFGNRRTIIGILCFTAILTGLFSVAQGRLLEVVVVLQPAFIAVLFPAQLTCLAEIGEPWYQNVTISLIITVGMGVGAGLVPALLGIFGDYDLGWLGFVCLSSFIFTVAAILAFTRSFCRN
jgi:NNP family nitrate/nitrite transporter-like MFS transporter